MALQKVNKSLLLDYLKFFGSYLLIALIGVFIESYSSEKIDIIPWIMICGAIFMILVLILLNRKSSFLKDHTLYVYNLLWVSLLILLGLITEHTLGFSDDHEFISEKGIRTIIFIDTIYYHIFVFIAHAFILSTLLLFMCSIGLRKLKPIIMTISTLVLIFLYFLMTV